MAKRLYCDECEQLEPKGEATNPCIAGHRMAFKEPETASDYNWGFYRTNCKDRIEVVDLETSPQPAPFENADELRARTAARAWAESTRARLSNTKEQRDG